MAVKLPQRDGAWSPLKSKNGYHMNIHPKRKNKKNTHPHVHIQYRQHAEICTCKRRKRQMDMLNLVFGGTLDLTLNLVER